MASTVVFEAPQGQTVVLELYPDGSDTIANGVGGDTGVEATARKGRYTATVSQSLSGLHWAAIRISSVTIATGWVQMTDGVENEVKESRSEAVGYSLAATGLDAIAVTRPTGKATTFPAMLVQLFYRFFGKVTQTRTEMKTYAVDGTTVVTTQAVNDNGTTETQGEAS